MTLNNWAYFAIKVNQSNLLHVCLNRIHLKQTKLSGQSDIWVSEPPKLLQACVGENVTFNWEYNSNIQDDIEGIHLRKDEPGKVTTYIMWHNNTLIHKQPDVTPYSNAGMVLINAQITHSGMYQSGVYYKTGEDFLSRTNLTVYNGKRCAAHIISVMANIQPTAT